MNNILRISDATSLALHSMVLLAANEDEVLSTREIAATLQVSQAHLSKVMQRLAKVGLVASTRGPRGGFKLGKAGEQISLLEVYQAIEGALAASHCLLGTPICKGEKCILGGLLAMMNRQTREYLAGTSLAELTGVYGGIEDEKAQNDNQD